MAVTGFAASRITRVSLSAAADTWSAVFTAKIGHVFVKRGGTFPRTFPGVMTLQRSHDNGATWDDVDGIPPGAGPRHVQNVVTGAWYRCGIAAGAYTSGTLEIEMAQ